MTSTSVRLSTAIGAYPVCEPLRSGSIQVPGVELDQVSISPISNAILRMCRGLEFEVCEMSLVTFFAAKRYGLPFSGIPAFPLHGFEHGYILYNEDVVKSPKDFEGNRVGSRAYTQTPGVWMRGILQDELGVDVSKVNWILSGEEHVDQYHKDVPSNVKYEMGSELPKLLASGNIVGGLRVQRGDAANVKPFFPDADAAGIAAFERTGVYPIGHCICVRDDVLAERPALARDLFEALKESREIYLQQSGTPRPSKLYEDPMPIGMSATRKTLDKLMELTVSQGILEKPLDIDQLFPGGLD
jgi:4,5-dihydroxyphthalate decarboxylase